MNNKWLRRAVGTVGVAGSALLFATGAAQGAQAAPTAPADPAGPILPTEDGNPVDGFGVNPDAIDPSLADRSLADPSLSGAGVSVDAPGYRTTAGALPDAPPLVSGANDGRTGVVVHAPNGSGERRDVFFGGQVPDMFRALPVSDAVPSEGLGLPESAPAPGLPVDLPTQLLTPGLTHGNTVGVPYAPPAPLELASTASGMDLGHLPPGGGLPVGHGLPTTGGIPVGDGLPTTGGVPLNAPHEAAGLARTVGPVADRSANPVTAVSGLGRHAAQAQPELGEGLPVVSQFTGGGVPLDGGLGGLTRGNIGGVTGYIPRHAA